MPEPVPGRFTIPPESPSQGEQHIQKSASSEVICPSKSTVKGNEIPVQSSIPASSTPFRPNDMSVDSPLPDASAVQKSSQSEFVCMPNCPIKVPTALFTQGSSTICSIPASSGVVLPIQDPIWNAHQQTINMVPSPSPIVSPFTGNFRSTFTVAGTLGAQASIGNYSGTAASLSNSSSPQTILMMGNTNMQPISEMDRSIKNAQSVVSQPIFPEFPVDFAGFPTGSFRFSTGSVPLPPSPAHASAPTGRRRVNSVELPSQPAIKPLPTSRATSSGNPDVLLHWMSFYTRFIYSVWVDILDPTVEPFSGLGVTIGLHFWSVVCLLLLVVISSPGFIRDFSEVLQYQLSGFSTFFVGDYLYTTTAIWRAFSAGFSLLADLFLL